MWKEKISSIPEKLAKRRPRLWMRVGATALVATTFIPLNPSTELHMEGAFATTSVAYESDPGAPVDKDPESCRTSSISDITKVERIFDTPENPQIDKIFSDETYKNKILTKINDYVKQNNWDVTADRYISLYQEC